jgi:hypothetical protein
MAIPTGPILQAWLNFSIFAFNSPELEALFTNFSSGLLNSWTLVSTAALLMGWITFVHKNIMNRHDAADLPPHLLSVCAAHLAVFGAVFAVMLFKPELHFKHRRAIHAALRILLSTTYPFGWFMVLWMRSVRPPVGPRSLLQGLNMLSVENMFITSVLIDLGYSCGQIPDLLLNTLHMVMAMMSNRAVCASPRWGKSMVTMSPVLLTGAEAGSRWLHSIGASVPAGCAAGGTLTCPAALAFWQVVGWFVGGVTVFVTDVLRRRMFLRSIEVQAYLGPRHAAAALQWPFQSLKQVQTCVVAVLFLCYASSLIWYSCLPFLC